MEWEKLLSKKRFGVTDDAPRERFGRNEYEADVQRVVFSNAFRRLGRKTQVHPLAANDHIHTRLTHSLEVSQVGRSLGVLLGERIRKLLPDDVTPSDLGAILQASCLAHDIGNPPFGHAGEEAMAHWFEQEGHPHKEGLSQDEAYDIAAFEGNAQGFRILTQTENHLFAGGLRCTYAMLGAFLKYPWTSAQRGGGSKYGAFMTERHILTDVATELGMVKRGNDRWSRHPLAFLVEAADDICYAILDLEDGVELRILTYTDVEHLLLEPFDKKVQASIRESLSSPEAYRVNLARIRGHVFDLLINTAIEGFICAYDSIMAGEADGDVFGFLDGSWPGKMLVRNAKQFAKDNIFSDSKKVEIELGSFATLGTLLSAFAQAASNTSVLLANGKPLKDLDWQSGLVIKMLGDHAPNQSNHPPNSKWTKYQCLRRIIDYISGMTDNYAVYIARQIQGFGFSGGQRP